VDSSLGPPLQLLSPPPIVRLIISLFASTACKEKVQNVLVLSFVAYAAFPPSRFPPTSPPPFVSGTATSPPISYFFLLFCLFWDLLPVLPNFILPFPCPPNSGEPLCFPKFQNPSRLNNPTKWVFYEPPLSPTPTFFPPLPLASIVLQPPSSPLFFLFFRLSPFPYFASSLKPRTFS